LQGKVNKVAAKTIKFSENPFLRDAQIDHIDSEEEEETPEEKKKREERELMEADGFTLVA
jgi:exopolysaccharide biosynthesis protein